MEIKIGCDPEFFLKKDGKHVSAYGLIDGDKKNPLRVNKGAVQVDGMALEFNIDPVTSSTDFKDNIQTVLKQLREKISKEYVFDFSPVAEFGKEYINAQPEKAKELGCDIDYNAYTGKPNPSPDPNGDIRTASGHIHIGWTENMDPLDPEHFEACVMLTKQLDMSLGIPSVVWDLDTRRASMYGRLGTFRPKPYGVEYRVLSNAWLKNNWMIEGIFNTVLQSTKHLLSGTRYYKNHNLYNKDYNVLSTLFVRDRMRNLECLFHKRLIDSKIYESWYNKNHNIRGILKHLSPVVHDKKPNEVVFEVVNNRVIRAVRVVNNWQRPRDNRGRFIPFDQAINI